MHPDVLEILLSEEQIASRVRELGRQISHDYQGQQLLIVGILKGAAIFCADLIRQVEIPLAIDFMAVSSYGASTRSSGVIRILKDLEEDLPEYHVLLVEDIVDTGLTLRYLKDYLQRRNPASLKICVLLDKPSRRKVGIDIDYRGFEIPDAFVVGYGLDYNEQYRNLSYISVLKPHVYGK